MRPGLGQGMERLYGLQQSVPNPAAMTTRVLNDAKRTYGEVTDDAFLERCASDAVAEIWGASIKVTTFVPVLAMRLVRDAVVGGAPGRLGAGSED
jgi:hypothetical protein